MEMPATVQKNIIQKEVLITWAWHQHSVCCDSTCCHCQNLSMQDVITLRDRVATSIAWELVVMGGGDATGSASATGITAFMRQYLLKSCCQCKHIIATIA